MMITTLNDISPVSDRDSQGKRIYNTIYVLLEKDIDYSDLPEIDADDRTCEAITMLEGATGWKKFSFVKFTPAATSEGSAGDITSAVTNSLTGTLGGERAEIDLLLENHVGDAFLLVEIDRFTQKKTLYGRPYSPLFLSAFSKRKNADNTSCDITFSNESFFQPVTYSGDPTTEVPPTSET